MLLYVDSNVASHLCAGRVRRPARERLDLRYQTSRDIRPTLRRKALSPRLRSPGESRRSIHDHFALSESSAICEYIDESFDGTPLYPIGLRDPGASSPGSSMGAKRSHADSRRATDIRCFFCGARRPALSAQATEATHKLLRRLFSCSRAALSIYSAIGRLRTWTWP